MLKEGVGVAETPIVEVCEKDGVTVGDRVPVPVVVEATVLVFDGVNGTYDNDTLAGSVGETDAVRAAEGEPDRVKDSVAESDCDCEKVGGFDRDDVIVPVCVPVCVVDCVSEGENVTFAEFEGVCEKVGVVVHVCEIVRVTVCV